MRLRCPMPVLLFLLALPLAGCSTLDSITIAPGAGVQTLTAVGQTAQYTAVATSQRGSAGPTTGDVTRSVTWTVTNPGVATINSSGMATAVGAGKTAITAQSGGVVASSDLTVTVAATVQTLAIVPAAGVQTLNALGQTAQFKAIETTQVGTLTPTTVDVTNSASWGVSKSSVAVISSSGLATAVGSGSTAITAQLNGITASSDLTVAVPAVVRSLAIIPGAGVQTLNKLGQAVQFRAIAITQIGTSAPISTDITSSVSWSANNSSVANINSLGLATSVGNGSTTVFAESNGLVASSDLTVSIPVTIQTLAIVPGAGVQTLNSIGETAQFRAIATTQTGSSITTVDVTNSVNWSVNSSSVATVNSSGLATALGIGNTTITIESSGVIASSNLIVTSVPGVAPTLTIIPGSGNATATTIGETTQFIALGNLSGAGAVQDLTNRVTWVTSDVGVATIDQNGLATGVGANAAFGFTTITALATTATGSVIAGTSTLTMVPGGTVNLPTLTIYKVGAGAAAGTVTSSPAKLDCGPQASGSPATCTAYFSLGSSVILTASPSANSSFAGWSANCSESGNSVNPPVALLAGQCVVKMNNNETVGAIFNTP